MLLLNCIYNFKVSQTIRLINTKILKDSINETIAIIPARGGSKGIPKKNIIPINGKPLIEYSIDVALQVKYLVLFASSDDKEILKLCSKYKSVKLHNRPNHLATDSSSVVETINQLFKIDDVKYDLIVLLQPTSPLRNKNQIEMQLKFWKIIISSTLVSVCAMDDTHPARMYWKDKHEMKPIMSEYQYHRRQDIPKAWYRNGAIYIVRKNVFLNKKEIINDPIYGYEMPKSDLLNIDEPIDLELAKILLKNFELC